MSLLNPPPCPLSFFSGRVPLLLPLAKQPIKNMLGSGRDLTRCKQLRQPITALLRQLGFSSAPLIGFGRHTDVSSLMIFVTIKLIVVYGSEIQECGGKWERGSSLTDREVGREVGGRDRDKYDERSGRLRANCGGDCGLTLQGVWRQGLHTYSVTHTHT